MRKGEERGMRVRRERFERREKKLVKKISSIGTILCYNANAQVAY